jgi:hypothetical protein
MKKLILILVMIFVIVNAAKPVFAWQYGCSKKVNNNTIGWLHYFKKHPSLINTPPKGSKMTILDKAGICGFGYKRALNEGAKITPRIVYDAAIELDYQALKIFIKNKGFDDMNDLVYRKNSILSILLSFHHKVYMPYTKKVQEMFYKTVKLLIKQPINTIIQFNNMATGKDGVYLALDESIWRDSSSMRIVRLLFGKYKKEMNYATKNYPYTALSWAAYNYRKKASNLRFNKLMFLLKHGGQAYILPSKNRALGYPDLGLMKILENPRIPFYYTKNFIVNPNIEGSGFAAGMSQPWFSLPMTGNNYIIRDNFYDMVLNLNNTVFNNSKSARLFADVISHAAIDRSVARFIYSHSHSDAMSLTGVFTKGVFTGTVNIGSASIMRIGM